MDILNFIRSAVKTVSFFRLALIAVIGVVYALSMARTASFWDCGEFIAASHVMGIPHPPGTPLFVILGRTFDVLLGFVGTTAWRINFLSALSSLLACVVVFEIVQIILRDRSIASAMRGALGFMAGSLVAFSSTFWTNAVEAEVYGLSMFLLVLGVWALLKGEVWKNGKYWNQFILFYIYLSFISIGVHTNSMLTFPLAWLYVGWRKQWYSKLQWIYGLIWSVLGFVLFMVVFDTEKYLLYSALAIAISAGVSIWGFFSKSNRSIFSMSNLALAALVLALTGYSVQLVLPIRSSTNPVMDQNNPETWESLRDALERKQYGSMGMLERAKWRRATWSHQLTFGERIGYLGYHLEQWAPAPLGAQKPLDIQYIRQFGLMGIAHAAHRILGEALLIAVLMGLWIKRKSAPVVLMTGLFAVSSVGLAIYVNFADGTRPDSRDAKYWTEAIQTLQQKLGSTLPALPSAAESSRIMGEWRKQTRESASAFLKTPDGQVIRNMMDWNTQAEKKGLRFPMPPGPVRSEVRERDYFYTPAFVFWAILVALALATLAEGRGPLVSRILMGVCTTAWLLPMMTHFATHNRSKDFLAVDYAYNTLMSAPKNSVLLTYGDNDTFPLWYAQMVEKVRTDVTVINMSLVQMDWYREQILRENPQWKMNRTEQQREKLAYQVQKSPRIAVGNDTLWWAGDSLWRPSPGHLLVSDVILSNWPNVPLSMVFNGDTGDMPGGHQKVQQYAPLAGLVRVFAMSPDTASVLLVKRMSSEYRYRNLERKDWQYQESTQRTIHGYRFLVNGALQMARGQERDALLKLSRDLASSGE